MSSISVGNNNLQLKYFLNSYKRMVNIPSMHLILIFFDVTMPLMLSNQLQAIDAGLRTCDRKLMREMWKINSVPS